MRRLLLSTLAAVAVTAAAAGAVQAQPWRGPVPAARVEVIPRPLHPGYIWRPGYWNWAGGRYVWVGGLYVPPAPGYGHWIPGHWTPRGRWIPAHWGP